MSGDKGHQTTDFIARAIEDKQALAEMMREIWGSEKLVVGMALYDVTAIDATGLFDLDGELHAVASWTQRNTTGYLCALHAITTGGGHAKQLLEEVKRLAKARGARTLRAMVSNDNMPGFIFYQKNGFRFSNLYVGAVDAYRPSVPSLITHGYLGIPVHDALELEIEL
jgi:ribosomal protein S18 acetylase RimI-like enzyme